MCSGNGALSDEQGAGGGPSPPVRRQGRMAGGRELQITTLAVSVASPGPASEIIEAGMLGTRTLSTQVSVWTLH